MKHSVERMIYFFDDLVTGFGAEVVLLLIIFVLFAVGLNVL